MILASAAGFTVPFAFIVFALVWAVISTSGCSSNPVEHPSDSGPPEGRSEDAGENPVARTYFGERS